MSQEISQWLMYSTDNLRGLFEHLCEICLFIDTYFSGKKQNFRSWDYFPHMPDHQDFHIIRCQNVKLD